MTALDWNSALEKEAPVEFMHVPQPSACALSCLCCECRQPQRAATVRCLERVDVYSPPYRVLKDMGWHVAAMQPDCALTFPQSRDGLGNGLLLTGLCLALMSCLSLKFWQELTLAKGIIFQRSKHCMSTNYYWLKKKEDVNKFYVAYVRLW